MRSILRVPEVLAEAVREVTLLRSDINETDAIKLLQSIDQIWDHLFAPERACIAKALIERIVVRREGISINWKTKGMTNLLRDSVMQLGHKETA